MAYADITTRDRNPVKRWFQRRRFSDALRPLRAAGGQAARILDYGAGNAELVRQARRLGAFEAWVFEPTPSLMAEAKQNLLGESGVVFVETLDSLERAAFDFVFCLEVFEHLPEKETDEAIGAIERVLKPGGTAVIGVPHELFAPALIKGLFRMTRRYGAFDATPANIYAALVGRPPGARPSGAIAPGLEYHFEHLGFDYRVLERRLRSRFDAVRRRFSPAWFLGALLNSEVYFVLRKPGP